VSHLKVPTSIVHCPYCNSALLAEPFEWEAETGRILYATILCEADLEVFDEWLANDKEGGDEYENGHEFGYDPDWMNACDRALNWVRTQKVDPTPTLPQSEQPGGEHGS